jgi:hypothetical protein
MLIRPFYAYFYAKQAVFCLSAHQDLFMLVRPFYAYQRTRSLLCLPGLFNSLLIRGRVAPNHAYQSGKKMKSTYLETTVFLATVCPVRFFAPAKTTDGTF